MAAFWISTYVEITDERKVAEYAALAGPALTNVGGQFLARGLPRGHAADSGGVTADRSRGSSSQLSSAGARSN